MTNDLIIKGTCVSEDAQGNLSLTDIWRIAGEPSSKKPGNWRQFDTTDAYVTAVADNIGKSYIKGEKDANSVLYTKPGKGGGTYGHILVAIGYAEYLHPDLAVEVRQTYLRVRAGDLTLVDEILQKSDKAREYQENRDVSKVIRDRYESVVATHGGAIGHCTNAIYKVLLGGTKKQIALRRNLPARVPFRDKLPLEELLQTMSTEHMASERIEDLDIRGHTPCAEASRRAAQIIKDAFERERRDRRAPEAGL